MKYFDLHCDTLYRCISEDLKFNNTRLTVNADSMADFSDYRQCFAIWTPPDILDKAGYVRKAISVFKNDILKYKSKAFTPLLSVEGADFLQNDFSVFEDLLNENIFSFSLTWNYQNAFAGGAFSDAVLTENGIRIILELNKFNVPLDLAHLNSKSFYNALEYADKVVVSHTFIDDIFPHNRNITLEQMKLIKQKKGLVGLCFYPAFSGSEDVFGQIYKAVRFCLDNDLIEIISLGSDFDGAEIPFSLSNLMDLYLYLLDRNIDKNTLDKLMFSNANNYNLSLTNGQFCDRMI